jgi:hypothetical protein
VTIITYQEWRDRVGWIYSTDGKTLHILYMDYVSKIKHGQAVSRGQLNEPPC